MPSLYRAPDLYAAAFSWDPAREAAFYHSLLPPGPILDVGCGAGRLLAALGALGREVEGIDSSAPMVAAAAKPGLRARVADMRAFRAERAFAGAFCHLSTFRYLLTDADVAAHFDAMARAMPGASALYAIDLDLIGPDFDPLHPGQTWNTDGVTTTWRVLGAPERSLIREEALFCSADRVERRFVETLRAWTLAEFTAAVDGHGAFRVERWFSAPFEVRAPFLPAPWTPRPLTTRAVAVLTRR
ncbi:MAG: class I SAM-dependent methyltransferase [Planctomycetes bacterium]|nr:class I SAM-dependent methyltransferase [Planctomycetota bacterium]